MKLVVANNTCIASASNINTWNVLANGIVHRLVNGDCGLTLGIEYILFIFPKVCSKALLFSDIDGIGDIGLFMLVIGRLIALEVFPNKGLILIIH